LTKRLAVAIAVSVTLAACGGDQTGAAPDATGTVGPSRDIVEMLEADGRFR
jgi:ABC-type glycerol-3-phosphate transport system substrate-binding protein